MRRELIAFPSGRFQLAATIDIPGPAEQSPGRNETPPRPTPGVLFCHGFTGHRIESRRMYARLGASLAARGIGCFRFDHRGCGESDGDFVDFTPEGMLEDLRAALEVFLGLQWLDPERLAVVGYSLGGTSASYLLHRHPDFRTAVLWAPVARPDIIRDRLSQFEGFDGYRERGYFDYGGFRVSAAYLDEIGTVTKPVEWAAGYPGPVLFCHGQADEIVKPEQSQRFLQARRHPQDEIMLVPDADHGFTSAANIDQVLQRSEEWLARLLGSGGAPPAESGLAR